MRKLEYCKNEIKARLDCRDVLTFYGIHLTRSDMCSCFIHNERTPSCKVYNNGYYCFGCGANGDVIKGVQTLFNIGFREAMQKLNNDFCLNLPLDGEITPRQRRKVIYAQAIRKRQERKSESLKERLLELEEQWKKCDDIISRQKPLKNASELDCISNEYVTAIILKPKLEFEISLIEGEINAERKRNTELY